MKIGIIGGLGAAAGARLFDLLIRAYQLNGAVLDSDFPEVVLHSIPSKAMNETGITDYELLERELQNSVGILNWCGMDYIMIACNSAHEFIDQLQSKSSAQILNMVDAAIDAVGDSSVIGVLCSASSNGGSLYENALLARGKKIIQSDKRQQKIVDGIIAKAIAGKSGPHEQLALADIADSMRKHGAEKIILGCTELPLVGIPKNRYIDPSAEIIKKVMQ